MHACFLGTKLIVRNGMNQFLFLHGSTLVKLSDISYQSIVVQCQFLTRLGSNEHTHGMNDFQATFS